MSGKCRAHVRRAIRFVSLMVLLVACQMLCGPIGSSQTRKRPPREQPRPYPSSLATTQSSPSAAARETLAAASLGGAALPYRVLLPADYERGARRYPVLYLLHGLTGNENDWWTRTNVAMYAARYRVIVVTPGVGDSWYANAADDQRARYEDAMVRDLIPHIDARYRTLASWHGRGIAGLSMGGLGAMKFALRYPHLFAFAASFSGAFDVPRIVIGDEVKDDRAQNIRRIYGPRDSETRRDNDVILLAEGATPEKTRLPYLYVSTGANDPLPAVLLSNPRFADALRERKIAYEYHERPGAHDWRFWDAEIERALERMSEFAPAMLPDMRNN